MRIVLDMQPCQTSGNRVRGIGRYCWELALAMLRHPGDTEFWIALNASFRESGAEIQRDLASLIPADRFVTWVAPGPTAAADPRNAWRAASGEVLRESFMQSLNPDWVHIGNLFQGYIDDCVDSVPVRPDAVPVAVTHHDLIPLIYPDDYISAPQAKVWYARRLASLKRAALVLTNSEFTRSEAIEMLGLRPSRVVCISSGVSNQFVPLGLDEAARTDRLARYGISRAFVMYAGGADPRKNLAGLMRAYASLPPEMRSAHQLVLVGKEPADCRDALLEMARTAGMNTGDLVFTGFVSDEQLVMLYNSCKVYAFPSFREGFGLPALEAMACGAPVIAANTSSLPEVIGWKDAMFDPHSDRAIAETMHEALADETFRTDLVRRGLNRAKEFTWERSAQRALDAMRAVGEELRGERAMPSVLQRASGVDHAAWRELAR